jgi:CHAD domain-containing protein
VQLALYVDLLRRLTRDLAPLRSADVEQQIVERLAQGLSSPSEEGLEEVLAIATRVRLRALADLKARMNGGVWLRRLELIIASQEPMAAVAARALSRQRRRLRRQFRSVKPTAEALHKRRMKIRALRYVLERCVPDTATVRAELEQLRMLQDCLGEIHDEWVLRQRLARQRPRPRANIDIRSRLRRRRGELLRSVQKHQNRLLRIWKDMQADRSGDLRLAAVA